MIILKRFQNAHFNPKRCMIRVNFFSNALSAKCQDCVSCTGTMVSNVRYSGTIPWRKDVWSDGYGLPQFNEARPQSGQDHPGKESKSAREKICLPRIWLDWGSAVLVNSRIQDNRYQRDQIDKKKKALALRVRSLYRSQCCGSDFF